MNAHHDHAPLYRRFAALLHQTMGLDGASLGHSAIERAVDQRFAAWRADGEAGAEATLADYWEALQRSPSMIQALIEAVVVPETWFYRDAEAFAALARLARERIAERGTAFPLRILSLPCSTGEEPYTIAMTLLDSGIDAAHLRIDAMDISDRSLAVARRAVYGRNSFRGNAFPFRDAHFTRNGDTWRLSARITEAVRFRQANLMQLDAAGLGLYDFVFCRNVLIYFDRDTQNAALRTLNSVLAENGTLFVGPAETGLLMRHGMQSAKIPLAFAFYRAAPGDPQTGSQTNAWPAAPLATAAALAMTHVTVPALEPLHLFSAEPFAWPDPVARSETEALSPIGSGASGAPGRPPRATPVAPIKPMGAAPPPGLSAAVTPMSAAPLAAPSAAPRTRPTAATPNTPSLNTATPKAPAPYAPSPGAAEPTAPTGSARDSLQAAHALANAGRLADAALAISAYLEQHAPHADAFYLLGVLADANGDSALARGHYRKALYLDPQHAEALAHLATLLELEGDRNGARLLMQRASRARGAA